MRVIESWRDRKQPRLWSVVLAVGADEAAPAPGDTVDLDPFGACLVIKIRPTNSPEPKLQPGERVYGADVQAPDIR